MTSRLLVGIVLATVSAWADVSQAEPSLHSLIDQAMHQCHLGRVARERAVRVSHFEKGQQIGEQAVAIDDRSANAHFAVFCNLGELMRVDGELSIGSVVSFRRLMRELDRTLELDPNHLDALSSRGTLLVRLPVLLGGDADRGEQLLRHVIKEEPQAVNARLSLAKSYCGRGRHQEAVLLASEALSLAEAQQRQDLIPEANRVVSQLRAVGNKGN